MPWHLSRSDPRKVYDERHFTVCVCQNPDQATLIVSAVNRFRRDEPQTIPLRESTPAEKESAEHSQSDAASEHAKAEAPLTHTSQAEGCCAKHIAKASLSGALDRLQPWECQKCGTTYWPRQEGPLVSWEARADVLVFKG